MVYLQVSSQPKLVISFNQPLNVRAPLTLSTSTLPTQVHQRLCITMDGEIVCEIVCEGEWPTTLYQTTLPTLPSTINISFDQQNISLSPSKLVLCVGVHLTPHYIVCVCPPHPSLHCVCVSTSPLTTLCVGVHLTPHYIVCECPPHPSLHCVCVCVCVGEAVYWVRGDGLLPWTHTQATPSLLASQLESCQQLLEEEPSNKCEH